MSSDPLSQNRRNLWFKHSLLTSAKVILNIRIELGLCFDRKKLNAAQAGLFTFQIHNPNAVLAYEDCRKSICDNFNGQAVNRFVPRKFTLQGCSKKEWKPWTFDAYAIIHNGPSVSLDLVYKVFHVLCRP